MHVIKPQALGLSTRPIEFRKRFGLCVSACLHIPFSQAERGTLWAEQSMWNFLAKEMAQPLIDEGVAKLTPEFLVHGKAFPPDPQAGACAVRAEVAGCAKTLLAFGERYWEGGVATAPTPFDSLALDWAAAYGGPDHADNPLGSGRHLRDGIRWLPRTELPDDRLRRPDQAIAPAGFGALDSTHPWRTRWRGTYDTNYMQQHAPGFAPDTDWRYFNLAPPDQWLAQALAGDEAFAFDHMHPTRPRIDGHLPGLRARVFAGYRMAEGEPTVREVPLRLTTLWFFPHAERCIAIFQGLAEIATDDGSDVCTLLGAVERLGEEKSDAHYLDAVARRADPRTGPIYAIVDSDLLPEGLSTADPDVEAAKAPFDMAGLQADAQYARAQIEVEIARDKAAEMGQDPDALGIRLPPREKVPTGDALVPYLEEQMKLAQAQQWAALDDAVTAVSKAIVMAHVHKIDIEALAHRGPPRYDAGQELARFGDPPPPGEVPSPERVRHFRKLCAVEQAHRDGYLQAAHRQPPAHPMPTGDAQALRDEIGRAVAAGIRFFAGIDLTGADLSGLDLRDTNFEGAWLESVDLRRANVSGAVFASAVLAHASLEGVVAIGTRFAKANLGGARLAGGVFDDADFSGAMLMSCAFAGTRMRRARFTGANLLETRWGEADWSEATLEGQTFYRLDLRGMGLPLAELSGCNFIECDLRGVDLRGAHAENATFATSSLDAARLAGARCAGTVAVKGCSLAGADLSGADLRRFNFGASDVRGAKLVRAVLDGANLSDARLDGADLRLASAKGALLRRTGCAGALLSGTDLRDAILQWADLRGADLRRANLFGADLSRVRLDGSSCFDDALLTRARTWPRLSAQEQAA